MPTRSTAEVDFIPTRSTADGDMVPVEKSSSRKRRITCLGQTSILGIQLTSRCGACEVCPDYVRTTSIK